MAIDLMHVLDANRGRLSSSGPLASAGLGWLWQMRGGDGGETNSTEGRPVAGQPGSQSSAIRLRLSGAEATLSITMESNEADLDRNTPTIVDLTESELDGEHLAVIMRWLSERLQVHSDASRRFAPSGLTKWRLKRVLTYIDEHMRVDHAGYSRSSRGTEQNVLRRAVPSSDGLQAPRVRTSQENRTRSAVAPGDQRAPSEYRAGSRLSIAGALFNRFQTLCRDLA